MTLPRAAAIVALVAVSAFANSLGNGFAYDDSWFLVGNPVVTEGRFSEAFTRPSWPDAPEGTGNYRPLVLASFALEWSLWGGSPAGFHALNVVAHALVSLLVLALLARVLPVVAATVGAAFFAVHPVHVEAVANVMGRSEPYAALGYLGACLVYLAWTPLAGAGARRAARLLGLVALFAVGLGSKEIAATLPAALVLLELFRRTADPVWTRLRRELPTYLALAGVLAIWVLLRGQVLGTLTGESAAPGLRSLSTSERLLSAISVWPEYLRLMVFPLDLSVDYAPAVLLPSTSFDAQVALGLAVIAAGTAVAWRAWGEAPAVSLGIAFFALAVLPVSNLIVRADILLAERTLYLPSVGAAAVVGGAAAYVARAGHGRARRAGVALAIVACAGLMVRTVLRNPTWLDTYTMLATLYEEHPESWRAQQARALGLARVGDVEGASEAFDVATTLAPDSYSLLVDASDFFHLAGRHDRSEQLLARAIPLLPTYPLAYRRLAEQRIRRGDARAGHAAALQGLRRAGPDRELWALLSETYVAKGDLAAAIRARYAALAQDPASMRDWRRLAELLEAAGDTASAASAAARAERGGA